MYYVYRDLSPTPIWSGSAVTYLDTDVVKGTEYDYTVSARNDIGMSPNSTGTSGTPYGPPDAVRGFLAQAIVRGVELNWTTPAYVPPFPIVYQVFRDGTLVYSGDALNYTDGVEIGIGTHYEYWVNVSADGHAGPQSEHRFATPYAEPSAPLNLMKQEGDGHIDLNWSDPSYVGPGTITFHVYQGAVKVWNGTEHECQVTELTNGVTYTFTVSASNDAGEGARTANLSATPHAMPPAQAARMELHAWLVGPTLANGSWLDGHAWGTVDHAPVAGQEVRLYYSHDNATTWVLISSQTTNSNGNFSAFWHPPYTGYYLLLASLTPSATWNEAWANATLTIIAAPSEGMLTLQSNSTLTDSTFNEAKKELSFTVTGPTGTSGYVNVSIPREMVDKASSIKLTMDGTEVQFQLGQNASAYTIWFGYTHSSHHLVLSFGAAQSGDQTNSLLLPILAIVIVALLAISAVWILRRRR
jgi:hypothetical protein